MIRHGYSKIGTVKSVQKISLEGVDKFGKMPEGVKKFSGGNF